MEANREMFCRAQRGIVEDATALGSDLLSRTGWSL
jgi:hypothetical protein